MDKEEMLDKSAVPVGTLVRPVAEKAVDGDHLAIEEWISEDGYLFIVVGYDEATELNMCNSIANGRRRRFFAYELDTTEQADE